MIHKIISISFCDKSKDISHECKLITYLGLKSIKLIKDCVNYDRRHLSNLQKLVSIIIHYNPVQYNIICPTHESHTL